ncbi:uncharacterized protein FPOAC1_013917 [Fusarium poae]|uniref:uncharacterized protein n=1 Tax=Fusarium poae TaxID=36050 RepID=UPI001D040E67|nr:uncharacterized protein FPOAC1_013917 [Fusarium poae]KAG8664210.1 hypothetical protein FPOAC1_013917 [Fusarium poae]
MVSKLALALFFGNALAGLAGRAIPPRCATEPTPEQVQNAQNLKKIESISRVATSSITIDTYFHFKALNDAYRPHNITFNLTNTTFTTNSDWADGNEEVAMKRQLRQGDYKTLNLYFTDAPNISTGSDTFIIDGCVVVAETVPGGSLTRFNHGGTAIHEVGHWFNLFHTFEDGCRDGDLVSDTPAQASATNGCPARRDSCPFQAGDDPIHNFMDYSDDVCYEEFTAGQKIRMHTAWTTYRK